MLFRSIVVRRPEHRDELVDELGVTGFVELPDMAQFDTIILAVKPQVLPSVLSQLTSVKAGATVISVAAGVTLDTLRKALPTAVLYRAMPNTPASIGCGMTALTADNGALSLKSLLMKRTVFHSGVMILDLPID